MPTAKTATAPKPRKAKGPGAPDLEFAHDTVIEGYDKVHVYICADLQPDQVRGGQLLAPPLTAAKAMELLGWESEADYVGRKTKGWGDVEKLEAKVSYGSDFLLVDNNKQKVRCVHNVGNRPFKQENAEKLAQEILNRRWRFNHETIIIGRMGRVIQGQHRLVALVLAYQQWLKETAHHWHEKWPNEPTMECLVSFGCDESSEVTRTLDNVMPRSLSDVLYTSGLFGDAAIRPTDQKVLTRMTDYATRLLWHRTWARNDSFTPRRTHSEALDFIGRHPKVIDCVKHVFEENKDGAVNRYLPPGTAAGLMYLMAAGATDLDAYTGLGTADDRGECGPDGKQVIDFSDWDKAVGFFTDMARSEAGDKHKLYNTPEFRKARNWFDPLLKARRPMEGDKRGEGWGLRIFGAGSGAGMAERLAAVIRAWLVYREGHRLKEKDVELDYAVKYTVSGQVAEFWLNECPTCEGIDQGDPTFKDRSAKEEAPTDTTSSGGAEDGGPGEQPDGGAPWGEGARDEDGGNSSGDEDGDRMEGDPTPDEIRELAEKTRLARDGGAGETADGTDDENPDGLPRTVHHPVPRRRTRLPEEAYVPPTPSPTIANHGDGLPQGELTQQNNGEDQGAGGTPEDATPQDVSESPPAPPTPRRTVQRKP